MSRFLGLVCLFGRGQRDFKRSSDVGGLVLTVPFIPYPRRDYRDGFSPLMLATVRDAKDTAVMLLKVRYSRLIIT